MISQPGTAIVSLDHERTISPISPLLFGGFAEHMGRCIYKGIYEPGSPLADERGFRRDVLAAVQALQFRTIRYPGGNFVSGYRWEDGIGPREQRPRRKELAWLSVETNQFGTHEFLEYCRMLKTEPMLAVNLGTGSVEAAGQYVEYCNSPAGTAYADKRVANGAKEPFGVRYWCLGNEMDGPWQIGHLDAHGYGTKALEAAKIMRWHDSNLKLILCGSSSTGMPTYPEWDRIVLEHCYEHVDYLSLHYYANNHANDTDSYLALAHAFEAHVDTLAATIQYVKTKLRSKRDVFLSWDEWNVWYKAREMDGQWQEAPHLIEEVYNLEDALVVAQWMNVFLRRSHVLKIACLAQIVNVIAPILTNATGLLKQSTYYPIMLFSRTACGHALDAHVAAPSHQTKQFGDVALLDVSASYDPETSNGAVFLVNRSTDTALNTTIRWQGTSPQQITKIERVAGSDPKAANTFEQPDKIIARELPGMPVAHGQVTLTLPPLSFTVTHYQ